MKRRWVYWRSTFSTDPAIIATRIDEDGRGFTERLLHLPHQPEYHWCGYYVSPSLNCMWRIPRAEALRRAGLKEAP